MTGISGIAGLLRDRRGITTVELALIGPLLIAGVLAVVTTGIHMQNYNSLRAVAYDTNRYAMVEYQKENEVGPVQIAQVASAIARRSPYHLSADSLNAQAVEVESGIDGAKRINLTLTYSPPVTIPFVKVAMPALVQNQAIIVPE